MTSTANFVLSQICWFCCVLGGAKGNLWLGPVATLCFVGLVVKVSERPHQEASFLALAALLGSTGDRLMVGLGAYQFSQSFWAPWGYPIWMSSLWLAFTATFDYSLKRLEGKYLIAALVGFVAGPLAYSAGASLGAISFPENELLGKLKIGLFWASILPILFLIKARLKASG